MASPSDEKAKAIKTWMHGIFGDEEDVPDIDTNDDSLVDAMSKLMRLNTEAERNAQQVLQSGERLMEELGMKSNHLMKEVNEYKDLLTPETEDKLDNLPSLACDLHLKQPTLSSFLVGLSEKRCKEMECEEKCLILDHKTSQLNLKIKSIEALNEMLERNVEAEEKQMAVQQEQVDAIINETNSLTEKSEEFISKTEQIEAQLAAIGHEPSLHHNELVQEKKELKEMLEKLTATQSELDRFKNLPPDRNLLQQKMVEAEQELEELEKEWDALFN